MLVKSKLKDGMVVGALSNVNISKTIKNSKLWDILLESDKRDFNFTVGANTYSILPMLSYYMYHRDSTLKKRRDMSIGRLLGYIDNVLMCDDKFDKYKLSNKVDLVGMVTDGLEELESDIKYSKSNINDLEMHLKYLITIDKLNISSTEVVGGVYLHDIYRTMLSLKYIMGCDYGYKKICDILVFVLYELEDIMFSGISKIDLKEIELIYLCLRKYLSMFSNSKIGDILELGTIVDCVSVDEYVDNPVVRKRLDSINIIVLPLFGNARNYANELVNCVQRTCIDVIKMGTTVATNKLIDEVVTSLKEKDNEMNNVRKDCKNNERLFNKELGVLKSELKIKEKSIIYKDKQITKLNATIEQKDKENGVNELETTLNEKLECIKELEAKLEQKDKRIASLESKNSLMASSSSNSSTIKTTDTSLKVNAIMVTDNELKLEDKIEAIKGSNYLLVGGNSTLECGLKKVLPNIVFKKHMLNFDISNKIDYVLVYTKNIGHRSSYKVDTFSDTVKGVIPLYNSNIPKIVDALYAKLI